MKEEKYLKKQKGTVYDDVFRTMAQKMPWLFVALINEVFGTNYPDDVKLIQLRNEFIEENGKVVTDSIFRIEDKTFHIECQSNPDGTMAIRMFEYDFAIALEKAINEGSPYEIQLPESCVLYLRHNDKTPDELHVMVTSGKESLTYRTQVIKVQNYSKDDIFKKKLLLFFPYYIMRYENEFNELESDKEKRKDLINEYREIVGKLDDSLEDSQFTDLVGLMMKIADYAIPKGIIRREVREVMGGKVLTLNTEKWFSKGHAKGRTEERIENIAKLLSRGGTEDQAKLFLDATDEEIEYARKSIVES